MQMQNDTRGSLRGGLQRVIPAACWLALAGAAAARGLDPAGLAAEKFRSGAGFSFRVAFVKGWPTLSHNTPLLPLEMYRGATSPVAAIAFADTAAPRPQMEGGWEHRRATYALTGGKASLIVSRLSPAVLIESDRRNVALRWAAGPRHLAFVRGGKPIVAAAEKLAELKGDALAFSEPWLLVWFSSAAPLHGWPEPFDVENERGVSKQWLQQAPPALDLPVLIRLEHKPASIRLNAGTDLELGFSRKVGKLALMPLMGGKVLLPAETQGWAAALPNDVLAGCRLWAAKLRDYPLTVQESFLVDADKGELTVAQKFGWLSFDDDWNSPPVKAAPVPPMLALAVGAGAHVKFFRDDKEVRPVDYHLMDTPGKAMGIEGADAYEYRIGGLKELLARRPGPAAVAPAARPLQEKLAGHVQEMVDAGPLQPLLYIYGGIGGTWFSHYYWSTSAELATALATAHPYLPTALQDKAVAYLKDEWRRFPPLKFDRARYTTGRLRTPYEFPWKEMRQVAFAMQREERYRRGDCFHELYGIDACLTLTGEEPAGGLKDAASRLAGTFLARQDWAILGPSRLRDERNRHAVFYYNLQGPATYNRWLAGAVGLTRLAGRLGWKDIEPAAWYLLGKLAMARVAQARYVAAMHKAGLVRGAAGDDNRALLHIDPTCAVVGRGALETGVHQNQELPPFCDLTEEVGRLLGTCARAECKTYLDHLDRSLPLWYISEAPKQQATEHRTSPLQHYSGNVLAQYWVLGKTGEAFTRYVDTTRFLGDLYYIRNLAAAIDSFAAGEAPKPSARLGLSVRGDGVLVKDGRPFRGIGVNYFDAFYRTLKDANDTSYDEGFRALASHGIPFARFMCGGFWPAENRLYMADRERYFRLLDGVVKSAERHGIGLIPSLFWHRSTVPDLVGEPCDQWGNAKSRTHAFLRTYTREVVTRYRGSPAVWGWEFGNEYNLSADLPNAARHRPPTPAHLGTPASRTARDELTRDMIRTAFAAFGREVRRHDPHRIITTGSSLPRPSAWHQRTERSWKPDTPEQLAEVLLADHADPINVISVHVYKAPERLKGAAAAARRAKKPLFVGEFGVLGAPSAEARRRFAELLALIETHRACLAALWVYDFARQEEWNVTATNDRAYQLKVISEANRRMRTEASIPPAR